MEMRRHMDDYFRVLKENCAFIFHLQLKRALGCSSVKVFYCGLFFIIICNLASIFIFYEFVGLSYKVSNKQTYFRQELNLNSDQKSFGSTIISTASILEAKYLSAINHNANLARNLRNITQTKNEMNNNQQKAFEFKRITVQEDIFNLLNLSRAYKRFVIH